MGYVHILENLTSSAGIERAMAALKVVLMFGGLFFLYEHWSIHPHVTVQRVAFSAKQEPKYCVHGKVFTEIHSKIIFNLREILGRREQASSGDSGFL